jgi:hypothetical protein
MALTKRNYLLGKSIGFCQGRTWMIRETMMESNKVSKYVDAYVFGQAAVN